MPTPALTITGTVQDIFGVFDPGAVLVVTLCGYGGNIPRVAGTALLVDVVQQVQVSAANGQFSFPLWGNDVITPGPNATYYTVSYQPGVQSTMGGGTVKAIAYQFTGSGTIDLSQQAPFNPSPVTALPNAVITNPTGTQTISQFGLVSRIALPPNPVASSATPVFDCNAGTSFRFPLNQNATSSTLVNGVDGEIVCFEITQGGGFTFAWPGNVANGQSVDPGAGKKCIQVFHNTGGTYYPITDMIVN